MGSKDISFLAQPERQDIAVFEGVFDFLSMLTYHGQERANANVLVLNSVALVEPAILRMKEEGIQKLYGYLDRDSAGRQALETLRAANSWQVKDGSSFYRAHKDLNEFLQHHQRQKHLQQTRGQIELER